MNTCKKIRLATAADIPEIMTIVRQSIDIMNREYDNYQWEHGVYPLETHFLDDIEKNYLWLVEIEDKVGAFIAITDEVCTEYATVYRLVTVLNFSYYMFLYF